MDYYYFDWEYAGVYAHGVGPATEYVAYWPGSLIDAADERVDETKYSEFVKYMSSLDLVVIPYALREEEGMYTPTVDREMAWYAHNGCYGIFSEHLSGTRTLWDSLYPEDFDNDPLFFNNYNVTYYNEKKFIEQHT